MAEKTTIGELVYKISGDGADFSRTIKEADSAVAGLDKSNTKAGKSAGDMALQYGKIYAALRTVKAVYDETIGNAIAYESAFAGVRKTVDGTEAQLKALEKGFLDMSRSIPVSANELAHIGEIAGQLGVPIGQIRQFTDVIAKVGVTTNLSTEQAATDFARFANIMSMPVENTRRLASTLVELGNNSATTERDILNMAMRLAGAGATLKMTESQVIGWSAALSSVGIEAELGGSALSRFLLSIATASSKGGDDLEKLAAVAGMTAAQFKQSFAEDASGTLEKLVAGMAKVQAGGGDLIKVLDALGVDDIRLKDALLRLVSANDAVTKSLDLSAKGWEENNALQVEADKRFKTTASQQQLMKNNFTALAVQMANYFLPVVNTVIKFFIQMGNSGEAAVITIREALRMLVAWTATGLVGVFAGIIGGVNAVIKGINKVLDFAGIDKRIGELDSAIGVFGKVADASADTTADAAKKIGEAWKRASGNVDDQVEAIAEAQKKAGQSAGDAKEDFSDLFKTLDKGSANTKKASQEAEKMAENYKKVGSELKSLRVKGQGELKDLAASAVERFKAIDASVKELNGHLDDLKSKLTTDLSSQDLGIAEKIAAQAKAAKELEDELNLSAGHLTGDDWNEKWTKLSQMKRELKESEGLQSELGVSTMNKGEQLAGMSDFQRAIYDYQQKRAQTQKEYEDAVADTKKKIALAEQEKKDITALNQKKQEEITAIIELGNKRFEDLAKNRVKITEDEVTKQIDWYNRLADAIARTSSAKSSDTIPKEQFSVGGFVGANGGEVHAGEYVIPAHMVARMGGVVRQIDAARTGSPAGASTTINAPVTMNNNINGQVDLDAAIRSIGFEINRLG